MTKPILCVDFDGVIHSYEHGWRKGEIYGTATAGFFDWLEKASTKFKIIIYSSRSDSPQGIDDMCKWLEKEAIKWYGDRHMASKFEEWQEVDFASKKPPAFLTIDDRTICFQGDWSQLDPDKLLDFKPWNQR